VEVSAVADVVVYTRAWCPYCRRAKKLLERKGVAYEEIDVGVEPELEREMIHRAGGRTTVPQIFIDGRHVGGSDDLFALEGRGGLDELLGNAP
jgi:glutaredoxin 3